MALAPVFVSLFVLLIVTLAYWRWGLWLARRPAAPRVARSLPFAIVGIWLGGSSLVLRGELAGYAAAERDDPSQRARILAESISEAINWLAAMGIVFVLVAGALLAATWRWHWARAARL